MEGAAPCWGAGRAPAPGAPRLPTCNSDPPPSPNSYADESGVWIIARNADHYINLLIHSLTVQKVDPKRCSGPAGVNYQTSRAHGSAATGGRPDETSALPSRAYSNVLQWIGMPADVIFKVAPRHRIQRSPRSRLAIHRVRRQNLRGGWRKRWQRWSRGTGACRLIDLFRQLQNAGRPR